MAGPGGLEPLVVATVPAQLRIPVLRLGLHVRGTIQGTPGNLSLQASGLRIPLPTTAQLLPGQMVHAEVIEAAGGLQLRIIPELHGAQRASQANVTGHVAALVRMALEALGAPPAAERAAQLLPANLPPNARAIQSLLSLFTNRGTVAEDLQLIASLANEAAAAGAAPQALADGAATLAASIFAASLKELPEVLKRVASSARRTLEARLARALASGDTTKLAQILDEDLRVQLRQLQQNNGLRKFLQQQGKLRPFERAMERLLDRFSGEHLQNLRALELPYLFMELSFDADAPIRHAQVHIFGDDSAQKHRFDSNNATVVIDLSTTNLGDLWISISIVDGRCRCLFRVTEPEVVEAIEAASDELAQHLADAGYQGAIVEATLWEGDRLQAAADLMCRFAGLDATA